MHKRYDKLIISLIILNFIWAIAALIYDLPAIAQVPWYFLPFILICPVYPALLLVFWCQKLSKRHINDYFTAFSALPAAVYLTGALIYYPFYMFRNGFDWLSVGQILWVAFYGLQGFWILSKNKIKRIHYLGPIIYLSASFIIQIDNRAFDYLDFSNFSDHEIRAVYLFLLAVAIFLPVLFRQSTKTISSPYFF
jgi:hypothetical protein